MPVTSSRMQLGAYWTYFIVSPECKSKPMLGQPPVITLHLLHKERLNPLRVMNLTFQPWNLWEAW